jgi:hypothetical protein
MMMIKYLPDHHVQKLGSDHPKNHLYRPFSLKLLASSELILASWNVLRLAQGIIAWKSLQTYDLSIGPWYICMSSGIWIIISLVVCWGLWFEKTWAWWVTFIIVLGYAFWYWFDRLIFQHPHSNWPFSLVATFLLIAILIILLLSPGSRRIFLKGTNERKS